MLKSILIENFRCLRRVQIDLRPLTVLVGPNDSGKSSFLVALDYLITAKGIQPSDRWREDRTLRATLTGMSFASEKGRNSSDGQGNTGGMPSLQPLTVYRLPSEGVAMQSPGFNDAVGPPPIGEKGEGVPTLFDYLLRRNRKRFFEAVDSLRGLIRGLEEVEIATPDPRVRQLDLLIENGFRIPADRASTGVRLMLFFVALAYHPIPPKVILLEEPENGVHPKRLADVMRLLRDLTEGKHGGQAAQVILTTHSPYLLDMVDLSKDQVLVFRRNEDGSRAAEAADAERLKLFLDEFMLGEVWYNQGEERLVAKQR
jgi:predicted ATPase